MKNQCLGFLAFSFLLCSCTKQEQATPSVNSVTANVLAKDFNFLELVKQEKRITHFITELAIEKGLTIVELKNKLQDLHNKDLNSLKGDPLLNAYLGTKHINTLKDLASSYRFHYHHLNNQYGNLTMMQVDTAVREVYQNQFQLSLENTKSIDMIATNALLEVNKANDCGWKYTLCIAGATSAAIVCHAGCIGSTAGFGTPVCVVLCGTIQAAAGLVCLDNYCPLPE